METAMWSLWWTWMAAALVLGILEIVAPGYVFLGFAIGAGIVGLLLLVTPLTLSLPWLLLVFAALSLCAWLVLRRIFALPEGQVRRFKDDING